MGLRRMDTKSRQQKIGFGNKKKPPRLCRGGFVFAEGSSTNKTTAIAGGC
jgi:hypothetical protein